MTYRNGKCTANCGFCPQARESSSRTDLLSRVSWPIFPTKMVLSRLSKTVKNNEVRRVCIQALNYPQVFEHLIALVDAIREIVKVPVSISCQPLSKDSLRRLAEAGAERIGIPLDAAREDLFRSVKGRSVGGPYVWKEQFKLLNEATEVFGKGKVSTHLIVGLGETEKDLLEVVQKCVDMSVLPALFAFTPIAGTALHDKAQPSIEQYRRMQLARYLIVNGSSRFETMKFDEQGQLVDFGVELQALLDVVKTGSPFITSGCADCNRPYYNEKPSGPLYNYPRKLTREELSETLRQLILEEKLEH
jgi:biotin synthase